VYDDQRSDLVRAYEDDDSERVVNAAYSIGLWLKDDGLITDTVEGMPAPRVGIGPGMRLIAVNGKKFTAEGLRDALRDGENSSAPLELLIENTDYYRTFNLDYHQGEKYPHLVRDESKTDLLGEILKAR
jgi:predicted metalloprotease with PDZ domain